MKTVILITSFVFAVAFSPAFGAETGGKATAKETPFIKTAADAGMTEVELGQVAEKNAQRADVKKFGTEMVSDHGKANNDLKTVATKLGVTIPDKVSAKHQTTINMMSKKTGTSFDDAYVTAMISDHEKVMNEFEKSRATVSDPDLKRFIDDTLPVIKHHLEMAKELKKGK